MTVGDVCKREVLITQPGASVLEAATLMKAHHVGDLVVVHGSDSRRQPVGIITDRDIALALVDWPHRLAQLAVSDVMSANLIAAREYENLYDALKKMRSYGVRRLPVISATGELAGIVTFDDLVELLSEELSDLASLIAREGERERQGPRV